MKTRKKIPRGARNPGPKTAGGERRHDKEEFGDKQWLRRYNARYFRGGR